jgi:LPXTG-site transpeptidase (sortase) family protein
MKTTTDLITIIKKLISLIAVIAIFSVLGYSIFKLNEKYFVKKEEISAAEEKPLVFEKALEPIYGEPLRIAISSTGIDAEIEPVGVATDGSLETPKTWEKAGWFQGGANPGQEGNLIINAHYDDNFGRPAAFWQLKNVGLGDTVIVVDTYGRRYEYKVTEYDLISINDPNRADVFNSDESAKITLITCGGVWIPGKATYDKRLVIKGELIH